LLVVKKFGGSSLASEQLIFSAAKKIISEYNKKKKIVVVLSARGDMTDELIMLAENINSQPSKRELDFLLSTGEMQSVAIMAMAIHRLGYPAVSLSAYQAKIYASDNYSDARIFKINPDRILRELDKNNIVIITGFQAINSCDDLVTLGRGGSDTSAVALAIALKADMCEIYTDVDGIFTADPGIIKTARKINQISYDNMLELASQGAIVMHNRSVELAKKYNLKLIVRSSLNENSGTVICEAKNNMEQTLLSGIAINKNIALISLIGMQDNTGMVFKLFSVLARNKICVDLIIQSVGRQNTKDISFTVAQNLFNETINILEKNNDFLQYDHLSFDKSVAKLSLVGSGLSSNPDIATKMFEAIYNQDIKIKMISTSEIKLSVLIDKKDLERAAQAVHEELLAI